MMAETHPVSDQKQKFRLDAKKFLFCLCTQLFLARLQRQKKETIDWTYRTWTGLLLASLQHIYQNT